MFYFRHQVKEDLLPEQHRGILVEQLNDILRQLQTDPAKIPVVHFTPDEVSSPTRERKERNESGSQVRLPLNYCLFQVFSYLNDIKILFMFCKSQTVPGFQI
jgi:hypothetical protein